MSRCEEFFLQGSPHEQCDLVAGHEGNHHFKTPKLEVFWNEHPYCPVRSLDETAAQPQMGLSAR